MIKFLIKGILRDHYRSLFPIIVVSLGVMLSVIIYSYLNGEINDLTDANARFDTGHLKIMTVEYKKLQSQIPNDLALTGIEKLTQTLEKDYNNFEWVPRIRFVGLLDVPDENGETKSQNPIFGLAVNILSKDKNEIERLNLQKSIVRGKIPAKPGEILIGEELATDMKIKIGQSITLLSTTANSSMAIQNFIISGTVMFGVFGMDRGAIIADLSDMQYTLEMSDCASEILGFSKNKFYNSDEAIKIKNDFNHKFGNNNDRFSPLMQTLADQNGLDEWLNYVHTVGFIIVGIFLIAMSIVLLNSGLMNGIRRYGEVGVRLALGESKIHVYKSLLYESLVISFVGSLIGTALGLAFSLYLQEKGIDIAGTLRNSSIMMSNYLKAKISATSFYIGFIPGLFATLIGTIFSCVQIFKRQTASLFKELEA